MGVEDSIKMRGYLDLKVLSEYACYSVSVLRKWLTHPVYPLPHYLVDGKIVVKVDEYDNWIMNFKRIVPRKIDIDAVVDEVFANGR